MVFMPTDLVHITFPYYNPGDIAIWVRKNGNQYFSIQPGYSLGKPLGCPYGIYPRLLMPWITRELKQNPDDNIIHLGDNLSAFMRQLDLDTQQGGKRSPRANCQKQLQRFFRAKYSTEYTHQAHGKKGLEFKDLQISTEGKLWWDYDGDEANVFDGTLTLSDEAAKMFRTSTMPVDLRILSALRHSCMEIDYCHWLHLKTFIANKKNKGQKVPWRASIKQFGSLHGSKDSLTVKDVNNYTYASKQAINNIHKVCPYLNIQYYRGGVEILPAYLPLQIAHKI